MSDIRLQQAEVQSPCETPVNSPLPVLSTTVNRVQPSQIRAIATIADECEGTLRLFVGEDTRPTPDFIKAAAHAAIESNKTYYTANAGYPEVRQGIASHLRDLHGIEVDPSSQIIVTSSGMNALLLAIQATLGAGSSAVVVTPLWPNTVAAVKVSGADAIEFPLTYSADGYRLDYNALERAIRPDTRLLALASPGNPTAWMASIDDWRRIADVCERHNLWLLADSVYERIVFEGTCAPSPFAIPELRDRLIVAQSFSKAYRMTGWRMGYAVAPPALGRVMTHLQEFVVSNAPGVNQYAAMAALAEGEPFIAESQARYARNKAITLEALSKLDGVETPKPSGAFYVFPKLRGLTDSFAFCEWLVREYRVGIAPGMAFGAGGEGHVRICFAVEEPILREALDRFSKAWTVYARSHNDGS